jgi:hypothetical protein
VETVCLNVTAVIEDILNVIREDETVLVYSLINFLTSASVLVNISTKYMPSGNAETSIIVLASIAEKLLTICP